MGLLLPFLVPLHRVTCLHCTSLHPFQSPVVVVVAPHPSPAVRMAAAAGAECNHRARNCRMWRAAAAAAAVTTTETAAAHA